MTHVPTWEEYMAPVLRVLSDGQVRRASDASEGAADDLGISAEERKVLIPSGRPRYIDRAGWALSDLYRVGALERPARGQYRITDLGHRLLADHPNSITKQMLLGIGYLTPDSRAVGIPEQEDDSTLSPSEQAEQGVARINAGVAGELLTRLHGKEPAFFERAVIQLLVAMGYGGADGTAQVTSLSNDGGIDGIIDQDALGLNRVYVQAKRYAPDNSVQRPEIQGFVGALSGKADGGIFITTGRFSKGAVQYADSIPARIILIDGVHLTNLMIKFGVGVQVKRTLRIVAVDEDFFE